MYPVAKEEQQRIAQEYQQQVEQDTAAAASLQQSQPSGTYDPAKSISVKPYRTIQKPGAK